MVMLLLIFYSIDESKIKKNMENTAGKRVNSTNKNKNRIGFEIYILQERRVITVAFFQ
jgi:hypothetical protein